MTSYPVDSPHAVARLLALAVTVDGVPAEVELQMLESRGVLRGLKLTREDFEDVMDALCADLRKHARADQHGFRCLTPIQIHAMLDEIRCQTLQREVAALLFDIFNADHRLVRAESILLWDALDHWGLHLREIRGLIKTPTSNSHLLNEVSFTQRAVPV